MVRLAVLLLALASPAHAQVKVKVAVTVDDLLTHGELPPGETLPQLVQKLVDTLEREKIRGVYAFVTEPDKDVQGAEEALRIWLAHGHHLGNHTHGHLDANVTDTAKFLADVDAGEAYRKRAGGTKGPRFFRFPFLREGTPLGKRRALRDAVRKRGYRYAPVTVPFLDWVWNDPYARCLRQGDTAKVGALRERFLSLARESFAASRKLAKRLFGRDAPQILVVHAGGLEVSALPEWLAALRKDGAAFVPLEEALRDKAFNLPPRAAPAVSTFYYQDVALGRGLAPEPAGPLPKDLKAELAAVCR